MGAWAATKPCCHPPICKLKHAGGSKKENLKNSALQGQGKLELTSAGMETSHLPCEQPKRNLLSAFMWILVPFPHLQSPERAASAKVTGRRRFLAMHLKKRQRPSLNKPWHPLPECCRLTHTMGPREKRSQLPVLRPWPTLYYWDWGSTYPALSCLRRGWSSCFSEVCFPLSCSIQVFESVKVTCWKTNKKI